MNIGIVILVEIKRNVTNSPVVISPSAAKNPPAVTSKPNAIPATAYKPGTNRFLSLLAPIAWSL